jgi:heterodisulfide reductase subunit A-like polyferredoxin
MSDRPADFFSYYKSTIDSDLCTACGECIDRCPMDAIEESETVSEVKEENCIGCGLCVSICPEEAISLMEKPSMEVPQMTITETFNKIQAERMVLSTAK